MMTMLAHRKHTTRVRDAFRQQTDGLFKRRAGGVCFGGLIFFGVLLFLVAILFQENDEREINLSSVALHQRYVEEIKTEARYRQTIHLVVDTSLENDRLGVKAFVASPAPLGSFSECCFIFKQIEVSVLFEF